MTDIWQWVEDLAQELRDGGRPRIADLIDRIGGARVEEVEAMLPEALAAARGLKHPWLELYFRHWGLQARIARGGEGTRALPEAVALLEFAHRDDTINCPQSICTAHDLLCCYANVDGPGWAEERLSLAQETLQRVEPSCVCFECISGEYADALMDQGRHAEAEAFLEAQGLRMRQAGVDAEFGFRNILVRSVLHSGEVERALALLDADEDPPDEHNALERKLLRVQCLARLGRNGEAARALPAFADLAGAHYRSWANAVDAIVAGAPEGNSWQIGRQLTMVADELASKGAHRNAVTIALQNARLALARGSVWTARQALEAARRQLAQLRSDGGAAQAIGELEQQIEAVGEAELPVLAAGLLAHLEGLTEHNPEHDIALLLPACRERPEDAELVLAAAQASDACGVPAQARELLWQFLEQQHPQSVPVALSLLELSLRHGSDDSEVVRLAGFLEQAQPAIAKWCRLRLAQQKGRWREVAEQAAEIMALEPDFEFAAVHGLAAQAAMEEGDLARAVSLRKALALRSEQPGAADWELMTAASALGDWATVRWSADRLGLTLTGDEGVVREQWGWILVAFEDEGRTRQYAAQRSGPVTAQVVEVAHPRAAQHVLDEVVFDATLLEPVPDDEEERKTWLPAFRVVHVTRAGGYISWLLDGAHPGEEALGALRTALDAQAWLLRQVSSDDYEIPNPEQDGTPLSGILLFLATPASTPAAEVDARLRDLTRGFKHPWAWLDLARAAGADTGHHQHIIRRYGL